MSNNPIRVIVASPDAHVRGRLTRLIAAHSSFHVTEIASAGDLETHLRHSPVDLVVTDISIPASEAIVHLGSKFHDAREIQVFEIRDAKQDRRRTALSLHLREFNEQPFSRDELTRLARTRDEV